MSSNMGKGVCEGCWGGVGSDWPGFSSAVSCRKTFLDGRDSRNQNISKVKFARPPECPNVATKVVKIPRTEMAVTTLGNPSSTPHRDRVLFRGGVGALPFCEDISFLDVFWCQGQASHRVGWDGGPPSQVSAALACWEMTKHLAPDQVAIPTREWHHTGFSVLPECSQLVGSLELERKTAVRGPSDWGFACGKKNKSGPFPFASPPPSAPKGVVMTVHAHQLQPRACGATTICICSVFALAALPLFPFFETTSTRARTAHSAKRSE